MEASRALPAPTANPAAVLAPRPLQPAADRAFEQLYRRHAREIYQYALALLGNPADAEDAAQTTFLNAYRALRRGERPLRSQNWLIKIAHNVCRMRWREATHRPREVALDAAPEPVAPERDQPSIDEVLDALARLSFNQRAALVMRELEGRSCQEIADALGLSLSAVEALLFRARRRLRLERQALGVLGSAPLPAQLASAVGLGSGGLAAGGATLGTGLLLKAVALLAVGAVTVGVVASANPPNRHRLAAPIPVRARPATLNLDLATPAIRKTRAAHRKSGLSTSRGHAPLAHRPRTLSGVREVQSPGATATERSSAPASTSSAPAAPPPSVPTPQLPVQTPAPPPVAVPSIPTVTLPPLPTLPPPPPLPHLP